MIKLLMQKNYFHNDKSSNESKDKKKFLALVEITPLKDKQARFL